MWKNNKKCCLDMRIALNNLNINKSYEELFKENRRYYKCLENENVWSFREKNSEELVIVLVDEERKVFIKDNVNCIDKKLQKDIVEKLKIIGYKEIDENNLTYNLRNI